MILETVFDLLLNLIRFFVDMLNLNPVFALPDWGVHFTSMFLKCLAFFPFDVWSILISNIMLWVGIHFVWSVIEWLYIKIPGVS